MSRFTTFRGEPDLPALARRIHDLPPNAPPEAVKKATKALLDANPVLRDMSRVAPGTVIEVPATRAPGAGGPVAGPVIAPDADIVKLLVPGGLDPSIVPGLVPLPGAGPAAVASPAIKPVATRV